MIFEYSVLQHARLYLVRYVLENGRVYFNLMKLREYITKAILIL